MGLHACPCGTHTHCMCPGWLLQVWCCLLVVWFISVHGPRECSGAWQYDIGVGG